MIADFKRELIARTLFDLLKVVVAAAFASKFFVEFPKMVQLGLGAGIIGLGVTGILVCPAKRPKE